MSVVSTNLKRGFLVCLCVAAVLVVTTAFGSMGWNTPFLSGWFLAIIVVLLALYRPLRRLSVLPIAPVALWTTLHLFLGWLASALFVVHTGLSLPNGYLEGALFLLFAVAVLSGFFGQWLNHTIPQRLSLLDEEWIFERIPGFTRQLSDNAENIAGLAVETGKDSVLAEYYFEHLRGWMNSPRLVSLGMIRSRRHLVRMEQTVELMARHLSDNEIALVDELRSLIAKKYELDLSYTYQWWLKMWLLIHVPASFGMVVVMIVHAVVSHSYSGF